MAEGFSTEDKNAILLLCGVFGDNRTENPLSVHEYSMIGRWLMDVNLSPSALLEKQYMIAAAKQTGIDRQRLKHLLGRGVQLGFALEEWQRNGIWVICRGDDDYPIRYKQHLKFLAPPLLFGVGNRCLLAGGGLGIVGTHNVDQAGETFTRQIAELCAKNAMRVVAGDARGVDQIAMSTALAAGGEVIGLITEKLLNKSVERLYRRAIADGRLLLISPYHPSARFTAGNAMHRNKLTYAMADYGMVVSTEYKKGGTWIGVEEELKRKNSIPIFVRIDHTVPKGNRHLLNLGAIQWQWVDSDKRHGWQQALQDLTTKSRINQSENSQMSIDYSMMADEGVADAGEKSGSVVTEHEVFKQEASGTAYHAVLPLILKELDGATTVDELAQTLQVHKPQLRVWLKQAVEEKWMIQISTNLYKKADSGEQA